VFIQVQVPSSQQALLEEGSQARKKDARRGSQLLQQLQERLQLLT
jgi:hypothetical protein